MFKVSLCRPNPTLKGFQEAWWPLNGIRWARGHLKFHREDWFEKKSQPCAVDPGLWMKPFFIRHTEVIRDRKSSKRFWLLLLLCILSFVTPATTFLAGSSLLSIPSTAIVETVMKPNAHILLSGLTWGQPQHLTWWKSKWVAPEYHLTSSSHFLISWHPWEALWGLEESPLTFSYTDGRRWIDPDILAKL